MLVPSSAVSHNFTNSRPVRSAGPSVLQIPSVPRISYGSPSGVRNSTSVIAPVSSVAYLASTGERTPPSSSRSHHDSTCTPVRAPSSPPPPLSCPSSQGLAEAGGRPAVKPPVARLSQPVRSQLPPFARVAMTAMGVPFARHIPGTATGIDGRAHTTVVLPPPLSPPSQLQPVLPWYDMSVGPLGRAPTRTAAQVGIVHSLRHRTHVCGHQPAPKERGPPDRQSGWVGRVYSPS